MNRVQLGQAIWWHLDSPQTINKSKERCALVIEENTMLLAMR